MSNKQILLVVDAVANEKGVDRDVIFDALESALTSATKRSQNHDIDLRVSIDRHTGEQRTYRRWLVVEDDKLEHNNKQMRLSEARLNHPDCQVGDCVEDLTDSIEIQRIGAQTGKQVIIQKIREAERARVLEAYRSREGQLINGTIKRSERGQVILDLGDSVEAVILREDIIPREPIRVGERLRGYLKSVRPEPRGPQLFLSRTAPEFLIELFKLEVPEIGEQLIDIIGAARDPGLRAKIAVRTRDSRIDPVGACVGMRGARVQAISNELAGERVDIILWDENPAQFVINAMSPAEVVSIIVDEDAHSMDVAVREEQLSQAIGKNGQNVRLASQLTGWHLSVMTESQADVKQQNETRALINLFVTQLGVDEEVASVLVQEGFSSLEEVAYVPINEMLEIEDFDEDIVKELRNRAKDILVTTAIAKEEHAETPPPTSELLALDGMTETLARALAERGITSMDDLAEQSIDELMTLDEMDEQRAGALIMAARAPWFANEQPR
ncbi:transcription termination factor NusA [Thioflexithrix psekupsensis]|uniref:Transcription termination/antitermination protein NusA n=1 Tax=Thioflexithrix psekupsensis TaxID=1570016 RepID=A0A251XAH0_9GAMM|nr:transcription termination factor NusA [Thioflexithrix psekupsensis]OUD15308.1 transcription termination/antitermination protein NusA [Thioflexithrix psekupsensis]